MQMRGRVDVRERQGSGREWNANFALGDSRAKLAGTVLRWDATALLVILHLRPTFFVCASYGGNVDWRNDAIVRMRETG